MNGDLKQGREGKVRREGKTTESRCRRQRTQRSYMDTVSRMRWDTRRCP